MVKIGDDGDVMEVVVVDFFGCNCWLADDTVRFVQCAKMCVCVCDILHGSFCFQVGAMCATHLYL